MTGTVKITIARRTGRHPDANSYVVATSIPSVDADYRDLAAQAVTETPIESLAGEDGGTEGTVLETVTIARGDFVQVRYQSGDDVRVRLAASDADPVALDGSAGGDLVGADNPLWERHAGMDGLMLSLISTAAA